MSAPRNDRLRIRFAKYGRVRFTSHRDLARLWERSLRRSRLPVAYSEGFSPRPRLRFGLALATAHESAGEYLDIDLTPGSPLELDALAGLIDRTLPPGMHVQAVAPVDPGTPSLQEAVDACDWLVQVPRIDNTRAQALVAQALAATELPVTRVRKGKQAVDDVRPAVLDLRVADRDELPGAAEWPRSGVLLRAQLATHPRACRPAELLAALDATIEEGRVVRLHQWTTVDGVRSEPLPISPVTERGVGASARSSTRHALERAS